MSEYFASLQHNVFLQNALIAGLLASLACGIIGPYVVVRRIVSISGGISHAVLGGMGIAYFYHRQPLHGALIAAVIAALVIGWVSLRYKQHEDTIIGAIWALGMAIGLMFISRIPGYAADLNNWLIGDINLVSGEDLKLTAMLDGAILLVVAPLYRWFTAVCFDEEHARLQGLWVDAIYLLLLCLIALTVVTLIQMVGLILVIALLTLPSAIALQYVRSLGSVMLLATILGFIFTTSGQIAAYAPNINAGASIVVLAAGAYLISLAATEAIRRIKSKMHKAKV